MPSPTPTEKRLTQIEADILKLARVGMKSAGAHPDLVEILARYTPDAAQERRPHLPDETREAA